MTQPRRSIGSSSKMWTAKNGKIVVSRFSLIVGGPRRAARDNLLELSHAKYLHMSERTKYLKLFSLENDF